MAGPVIKTMDIVASFYSNCIFVFQFCVAYSFLFFLKALVSGISCTKILGCGSRITVNIQISLVTKIVQFDKFLFTSS